ncbi:MAG: DUF4347 domain-containing protein [Phycisphaerales bacterium]|nr:MAG: DUF4347 domain-containing protein [Phycisphaerales bacterium]
MAKLDIVVVSDPGKFDGFYFLQSMMNIGEKHVTHTQTMVKQILDLTDSDNTVAALTIHGHGNQTGQYVGRDWLDIYTLPKYREELAKLTPHFEEDAIVTLGGCNVGHAEALLQRLSELWGGIAVRAGTAQQMAFPGIEGGIRSCKVNVCKYGGPGFWDKFDQKVRPRMDKKIGRLRQLFR